MSHLEVQSLSISIAERFLCKDLSFTIEENQSWGLLGKNGAGKTSLLHSIAGLRDFDSGDILLNGKSTKDHSRLEIAREIGILYQDGLEALPATVLETVMLGRHPHVQSLFRDNEEDVSIAKNAMLDFSLSQMSERQIDSLSGGEKQRVAIAMLIAQAPNIFLLDEPSNHLDIAFQVSILRTVKSKIAEKEASMLMATHDINLAARFCDKFILLLDDGGFMCGNREEILTAENLSLAYACEIRAVGTAEQTLFYPA